MSVFDWNELPNGAWIRQVQERFTRYYEVLGDDTLESDRLLSSTGVLKVIDKPGLIKWAKRKTREDASDWVANRLGQEINSRMIRGIMDDLERTDNAALDAEKAAEFGTVVHKLAETYDGGSLDHVPTIYRTAFDNWLSWCKTRNVIIVATEQPVYSPSGGYAGTIDAIANVNDELFIIDYKTTSRVFDEAAFQVAAYVHAWNEIAPDQPVAGGAIVRLDKEAKEWEEKHVDQERALAAFLAARDLKASLDASSFWVE